MTTTTINANVTINANLTASKIDAHFEVALVPNTTNHYHAKLIITKVDLYTLADPIVAYDIDLGNLNMTVDQINSMTLKAVSKINHDYEGPEMIDKNGVITISENFLYTSPEGKSFRMSVMHPMTRKSFLTYITTSDAQYKIEGLNMTDYTVTIINKENEIVSKEAYAIGWKKIS